MHVDEDVPVDLHPAVTTQDRQHQRQPLRVDPRCDPSRRRLARRPNERVHLDGDRAVLVGHHGPNGARRPGPAAAANQRRARVGDVAQAALAHLEEAHLAHRAEAVLVGAQHAVAGGPLVLEPEQGVRDVRRGVWAREPTVLRRLTDQPQAHVERLRHLRQPLGHPRHRPHRPRVAEVLGRKGLEAVDDRRSIAPRPERSSHVLDPVGFQHVDPREHLRHPEPPRAFGDLRLRLLSARVERAAIRAAQTHERLHQQRRLAHPGRATEHEHLPRREPLAVRAPAEHSVQLREPRRAPRVPRDRHLRQRRRRRDPARGGVLHPHGRALRRLLDEAPEREALRAAVPALRRSVAALAAGERDDGSAPAHDAAPSQKGRPVARSPNSSAATEACSSAASRCRVTSGG